MTLASPYHPVSGEVYREPVTPSLHDLWAYAADRLEQRMRKDNEANEQAIARTVAACWAEYDRASLHIERPHEPQHQDQQDEQAGSGPQDAAK